MTNKNLGEISVHQLSKRKTYLALIVLCLFHICIHIIWLYLDTRPPFWDTAGHASAFLNYVSLPFVADPLRALGFIYSQGGAYPPVTYLISVPLAFLLGISYDVIVYGQIISFCVLIFSVYAIGSQLENRRIGLASAFLISFYPIIYGLVRHYLLDISLVAVVSLSIACLLQTDYFSKLKPTILLGVTFAVAILTKWTSIVFLAGPVGIYLIYTFTKNVSIQQLRNICLAFGLGLGLGIPWYFYHYEHLRYLFGINAISPMLEGDPDVWSWQSWAYYIDSLVNQQILLPFVLIFVIGFVLFLSSREGNEKKLILIAWIFVPYLAFSLFGNKDARYTMAYLPAVSLITVIGLSKIRNASLLRITAGLVLAYALFQFVGMSFGLDRYFALRAPENQVVYYLNSLKSVIYKENIHIASPPKAEDWQVERILRDVEIDYTELPHIGESIRVAVLPNSAFFEPAGFIFEAKLARLPIQIFSATGYTPVDGKSHINQSHYVITKTGNQGPEWTLQEEVSLSEQIYFMSNDQDTQIRLLKEYPLPDGSIARLYRRIGPLTFSN